MATRSLARAALLIKRDLTLGTLMDRLEQVHGGRPLVAEADVVITARYIRQLETSARSPSRASWR